MTDIEPNKLGPSPPLYYRLGLPGNIRPFFNYMPQETMLALDAVHYMAVRDIAPLNEVIDTVKIFNIIFHMSESYISITGEYLVPYFIRQGIRNKKDLNSAILAHRLKGEELRAGLDGSLSDHRIGRKISIYYDGELPQSVISKVHRANVLRYPSLQSVIDFLETKSAIAEVSTVLPILCILAGQIDRAIELYERKTDMKTSDRYNLGTIYLIEKQDFPEARKWLEAQGLLEAYYNRGMTYLYEENWGEAGECFGLCEMALASRDRSKMRGNPTVFARDVAIQRSFNNLGLCFYYNQDGWREAMYCFDTATSLGYSTGYSDGLSNRLCLVEELLDLIQPVKQVQKKEKFHDIIGGSDVMQNVYKMIKKAARNDHNILITGDTGTGKGLVAKAIHDEIDQKERPFIILDCTTIPKDIAESELFGHEKGAFTDATEQRVGKFQLADGGTLFIDEIGELSLDLQTKLLRVIQNKEFERVGGSETIKVDVKIILATKKDLEEEVKAGRFREDLYYRIKVIQIPLPPLSERKEDIPELIEHFLDSSSTSTRRMQVSSTVQRLLEGFKWNGNIRELEGIIEGTAAMADGDVIQVSDIPDNIYDEMRKDIRKNAEVEKQDIMDSLEKNNENIAAVSRDLGISRQAVYRRIKKYKIVRKASKSGK